MFQGLTPESPFPRPMILDIHVSFRGLVWSSCSHLAMWDFTRCYQHNMTRCLLEDLIASIIKYHCPKFMFYMFIIIILIIIYIYICMHFVRNFFIIIRCDTVVNSLPWSLLQFTWYVRSVPRNLQWSFFYCFRKQAQRSLRNFRLPYKFMFWRSNGCHSSSQRSLQVLLRPVLFGRLTDFAGNAMTCHDAFSHIL